MQISSLDLRPVLRVAGLLLCGLACAMMLPALVDLQYRNADWHVFMGSAALTLSFGGALVLGNNHAGTIQLTVRQAFLMTTVSWVAAAIFCAVPFWWLGLSYTDAFFETVSGFTTTGSTVIVGLDTLPPGILFWRALLTWVGGVGIIVMAIIILPFLRIGGMQLFQTESSDRSEKITARPLQLARWIAGIYFLLTFACALLYRAAGMSGFDAICHAMSTLATAGYSTHDASFVYFNSDAVQWVGTLFMMAGALPFVAYIRFLRGNMTAIPKDPQARVLILFLAAVSLVMGTWHSITAHVPFFDSLTKAAFNVTSIVTTTGYVSDDYGLWGAPAVGVFLILLFVGGCTGSTAGGIKVYRFQILGRIIRAHLTRLVSPHQVILLTYGDRRVTEDVTTSVLAFVAVYMATIAIGVILLTALGLDIVTALSATATALGNVGPGLGEIIGPSGNFSTLPDAAKWLLSGAMLLGRLEIFTILVLLEPRFWRS
jgi:trk system potassium uptake protein TrkH